MLFSVKYIQANIDEFQAVLIYFFRQLETNSHAAFSENLFPIASRIKLYKNGNVANGYKKFVDSFKEIFAIYTSAETSEASRQQIIDNFFLCNEIDSICNDVSVNPIHYDDMDVDVKKVAAYFNSFYDSSFSNFTDKQQHFQDFGYENGKICPVCGLETSYQYDHFIPKGTAFPIYPFSSVNPRNLIPICQGCNGPKSSKLIIYQNNNRGNARMLAFSPYSGFETWENLDFDLQNILKPGVNSPGKWRVTFTPKNTGLSPDEITKINCWKEFYKIEERFSKEIEKSIKIWIQEFQRKGKTFIEMVAETEPNKANIRRINSILLQNLLFKFIEANNEIFDQFVSADSTAEDPMDLLQEQEAN